MVLTAFRARQLLLLSTLVLPSCDRATIASRPPGPATGGVAGSTAAGGADAGGIANVTGGMTSVGTGGTSAAGGAVTSGGGAVGLAGAPGAGGAHERPDAGTRDAGSDATRALASPPTYQGTVSNAMGCTQPYITHGFEPNDASGTRHPLFLYFTGTNFISDEASFRAQSEPAADRVTQAMAARGFVALWVEYDNGAIAWLSDHGAQLSCLFGVTPGTLLELACALPEVDCDLGIATWGHSQGALIANRAYGFDQRVRAAWLAGYGGDPASTMPKNRIRVENGENDTTNGQEVTVDPITGLTSSDCPDAGTSSCFRSDGSGWVIVRAKDCVTSTADHCWFDHKTCTDSQVTLEQNWIDPASTKPFALEKNADWVAATVRRP